MFNGGTMEGLGKGHSELKPLIDMACRGNANVLITGPTGSGKTWLARKIHEGNPRGKKPFVTVNLATLHEGTFESELFGHEKGAFTGAEHRRVGRLEAAQGGTVFLDEVGELSPRLQARLLEFLQSRVISPVGSNREIRLDVRVIAATNKNLAHSVAKGEFREDLFHRLRVIALPLKPLSERYDEFDEIIHTTLSEVCAANDRTVLRLSEDVARWLERHDWPGNLRELRNVLEFAVLASQNGEIRMCDLPNWFHESELQRLSCAEELCGSDWIRSFVGLDYLSAVSKFEKAFFEYHLNRNLWRINRTARKIGMNKTTLIRRIREHSLKWDEGLPVDPNVRGETSEKGRLPSKDIEGDDA